MRQDETTSRFPFRRASFLAVFGSFALFLLTSGPRSVPAYATAPAPVAPATPDAGEADELPVVWWDILAELNLDSGEPSDSLARFIGQEVRIPGFMVPLEDWAGTASEFLLVPYVGACVHTPPPPPNQLVYVEMEGRRSVEVSFWDPIWMEGRLELEQTESELATVSFKMAGMEVKPYTEW
jgi:hypothetical protein